MRARKGKRMNKVKAQKIYEEYCAKKAKDDKGFFGDFFNEFSTLFIGSIVLTVYVFLLFIIGLIRK